MINAGDAVTVTIAGVTNPAAGTYTNFSVATSTDYGPGERSVLYAHRSRYSRRQRRREPAHSRELATYTITGLFAASAITGGLTANAITLTAPAGTVFPTAPSAYVITDSTTPSGSGTSYLRRQSRVRTVEQ